MIHEYIFSEKSKPNFYMQFRHNSFSIGDKNFINKNSCLMINKQEKKRVKSILFLGLDILDKIRV